MGGAVLNRRSLSFALVLVSMMFLVIMPLNADDSLGWEGVSFGLKINKYQAAFSSVRFIDLNDKTIDTMKINTERGINDPQFKMVVNTNHHVSVKLTFNPFVEGISNTRLTYDIRMYDADGYTPHGFAFGLETVDRIPVTAAAAVSFEAQASTEAYEYPFAFQFHTASLDAVIPGEYSCDLLVEVVSLI